MAGKKLVAKVDAKNKLLLDNYKEEEEERNKGNEDSSEAHEKKEDADVFEAIQHYLADHRAEIENYESIQGSGIIYRAFTSIKSHLNFAYTFRLLGYLSPFLQPCIHFLPPPRTKVE